MTRRTTIALLIPLAAVAVGAALQDKPQSSDAQAIQGVLQKHYVEGMYIKRDADLLRAGLAETFVMQVYWDGQLRRSTVPEWFDRMKLNGKPTKRKIESKIKVLDITGVAAVARVDLYRDSEHRYTDYFGLYKTENGWKMVTKMFHAHR